MTNMEFLIKMNTSLSQAKSFLAYLQSKAIVDFRPDVLLIEEDFLSISREEVDISECLGRMGKLVNDTIQKRNIISTNFETRDTIVGRFLIYSPLHSMMDGLADGETEGYFDVTDAPPYTTWLGFVDISNQKALQYEGYLIAWIPSSYISLADQGIQVSLGQSLFWADDIETAYSYGARIGGLCECLVANR